MTERREPRLLREVLREMAIGDEAMEQRPHEWIVRGHLAGIDGVATEFRHAEKRNARVGRAGSTSNSVNPPPRVRHFVS